MIDESLHPPLMKVVSVPAASKPAARALADQSTFKMIPAAVPPGDTRVRYADDESLEGKTTAERTKIFNARRKRKQRQNERER